MTLSQYIASLRVVGINVPLEVQDAADSVHRLHDEIDQLKREAEQQRIAHFNQTEQIRALQGEVAELKHMQEVGRELHQKQVVTIGKVAVASGVRMKAMAEILGWDKLPGWAGPSHCFQLRSDDVAALIKHYKG
jgi:FtsZ-binding cell division protein ZapB